MIHDASHPIWKLALYALRFAGMATVLYITADNFDATEVKSLILSLLVFGGDDAVRTMQKT
jgi:hypothetical protein